MEFLLSIKLLGIKRLRTDLGEVLESLQGDTCSGPQAAPRLDTALA